MSDHLATLKDREKLRDLRLRLGSQHLHRLGERPLYEFLREFAHHHGLEPEMIAQLERYRRITPEMAYVTGADRFPPSLAVLRGGRR